MSRQKKLQLMKSQFVFLVVVYLNVVLFFALLYSIFDLLHIGPIVDHYNRDYSSGVQRVFTALYFSVATLFSVGYGDVTPFGLSRVAAIIEAMLGYILPAILVIRYMKMND